MNYDVSYRVLATGRRPLFICKAIPNPLQDPKPAPPNHQSTPRTTNLFKIKQQFQEISFRLNLQQDSAKLGRRSMSCELEEDKKMLGEGQERLIVQKGRGREKQRRSIKQYLRLAYKRNEFQRRESSYKLPEIKRGQNQQSAEPEESQSDLQKVSTMKHIMKKVKNSERLKFKSQQKEEQTDFYSGHLSGWDHPNVEEQY